MKDNLIYYALAAFVLVAALYASNVKESEDDEFCESMSNLAETVMSARQKGVSLVDMLKTTDNDGIKSIIKHAFTYPRMMTEKNRMDYIIRFRDEIALSCYKELE